MKPQNDFRKQATSEDVEGFINTLTLLLECDRLSDSTKETLRATLCNAGNTVGEGNSTQPENIRAWLAQALNIGSAETATEHEDEAEQTDRGKAFLIFPDEAEAQHAIEFIMKGITESGLYILANILVELREMTSQGSKEARRASDEIGRIIELVFRHSRSYRQALRLYANRFDIIGGGDPDDYISELADRLLKREDVIAVEH
jgi:hypothetical protein